MLDFPLFAKNWPAVECISNLSHRKKICFDFKSTTVGLVFLHIIALLDDEGVLYYFKFIKNKPSVKGNTNLDNFYLENYNEDEPAPDNADASEDEIENDA